MKEKVSAILNLMKLMNVKVEDLVIYNGEIERNGKFPLEVFYSDRTRSFDISHYQEDNRHPLGIIINAFFNFDLFDRASIAVLGEEINRQRAHHCYNFKFNQVALESTYVYVIPVYELKH